jgi:predicted nucleotidyltransferase
VGRRASAADLVIEFEPAEIWSFGSVARSDDDADGDLDVLVVLDRGNPAKAIRLKQLARHASDVPAPFDVVFSDLERVMARRHIPGVIERMVLLQGPGLYRRD